MINLNNINVYLNKDGFYYGINEDIEGMAAFWIDFVSETGDYMNSIVYDI